MYANWQESDTIVSAESGMAIKAVFLAVIFTWAELQWLVEGLHSDNTTGIEQQDSTRRVIFGSVADPQAFPYMVLLNIGSMYCGGSIIANHWVLTASHCIVGQNCRGIRIRAAVWRPDESVSPLECINHPQFENKRFTYDISLLKVNENMVADGRAKPIPMPSPGQYFPGGTAATIVGWGKTEQGVPSENLLFANVLVKDWDWCNNELRALSPHCNGAPGCVEPNIPSRIVCISGQGSSISSACHGDSGGPLVINGILGGVFSHLFMDGNGQCVIGTPSLYTSTTDYLPWVQSFVAPELDSRNIQVRPEP